MGGILGQFDINADLPRIHSPIYQFNLPDGIITPGFNMFKSYDTNPHYWEIYFASHGMTGQARQNFINTNLGGNNNLVTSGATITGDASNNYIWGTTNGRDIVNGGDGAAVIA